MRSQPIGLTTTTSFLCQDDFLTDKNTWISLIGIIFKSHTMITTDSVSVD